MTKPWADQPFKLIATPTESQTKGMSKQTVKVATEMCLAHNIMVRSLNSIYHQCEGVSKPEDVKDFIIYCQTLVEEIEMHHHFEEIVLFPEIAEYTGEKDIMEANVTQHHAFHAGLEKFHEYIYKATFETYDGKEVKRMMEEFGPTLAVHLSDEIVTLLGLDKYGGEKLAVAWDHVEKAILSNLGDKHRKLPMGLGNNDVTFEDGKHHWPPLPWFAPYLVKCYFARKYKGSWRFCPCTFHGIPRPLEFVTED